MRPRNRPQIDLSFPTVLRGFVTAPRTIIVLTTISILAVAVHSTVSRLPSTIGQDQTVAEISRLGARIEQSTAQEFRKLAATHTVRSMLHGQLEGVLEALWQYENEDTGWGPRGNARAAGNYAGAIVARRQADQLQAEIEKIDGPLIVKARQSVWAGLSRAEKKTARRYFPEAVP